MLTGEKDKSAVNDDITELCCVHEILKDLCMFCRDDPEMPNFTLGKVWRERMSFKTPGVIRWVQEPRIEKVIIEITLIFYIFNTFICWIYWLKLLLIKYFLRYSFSIIFPG